MAKYLLTCACGREHTVETRQAGESIACDCGTQLAVPTLRQLRLLPEAREAAPVARATWGRRQGAITVILLLMAACLAIAALSRFSEQPLPTLDTTKYSAEVERRVSKMTPLDAWNRWVDTYAPLRTSGFEVYQHPNAAAIEMNLDWHRWIEWSALGLAGVLAVTAGVLGLSGGGKRQVS